MDRRWALRAGLVCTAVCLVVSVSAAALRPDDPVVLSGGDVPWTDAAPDCVVGYAYRDGWIRVPVQVDERDRVEFARIYGAYDTQSNPRTASYGLGVTALVYCDPGTFTGADSDRSLDENDEIVFMARDAGDVAPPGGAPAGAIPGSGVQVRVHDPLTDETGYIYLFLWDEHTTMPAVPKYVTYTFRLLAGSYKSSYNLAGVGPDGATPNSDRGPQLNPEDSWIRTDVYQRHWSYRWTCDWLGIDAGEGPGPNLIEREDYWIAPGSCGRHIGTFNAQEGALIANISGPVRAIRSYVGANSAPLIQVDRIYYRAREDMTLYVRLHPRPAVGAFYVDHAVGAIGMSYFNDLNPGGVLIDGVPDDLRHGRIRWELVRGVQGSVVRLHDIATDIDFAPDAFTLFYADQFDPEIPLCRACTAPRCAAPERLGDSHLLGASGVWITGALPNTDPGLFGTQSLTLFQTVYYGSGAWDVSDAVLRSAWCDHPLDVTVRRP